MDHATTHHTLRHTLFHTLCHTLPRVDARFVTHNTRCSFAGDTKLGMTAEEEAAWRERVVSSLSTSSSTGEQR